MNLETKARYFATDQNRTALFGELDMKRSFYEDENKYTRILERWDLTFDGRNADVKGTRLYFNPKG